MEPNDAFKEVSLVSADWEFRFGFLANDSRQNGMIMLSLMPILCAFLNNHCCPFKAPSPMSFNLNCKAFRICALSVLAPILWLWITFPQEPWEVICRTNPLTTRRRRKRRISYKRQCLQWAWLKPVRTLIRNRRCVSVYFKIVRHIQDKTMVFLHRCYRITPVSPTIITFILVCHHTQYDIRTHNQWIMIMIWICFNSSR